MRGLVLLGAAVGTTAAMASSALQQPPAKPAPDPVAAPADDPEGEIVVMGQRPITRQGAWVYRRSDIVLLGGPNGPIRLVPAASWAACMPAAQTDAMVRWLAQTGPYLTDRETTVAVAALSQADVGGAGADTNDLMAILPSNLTCYPPRRSTLDGGRIDVLQYCRQRKVAMGAQRRSFQMRLIGKHTSTAISMRFSIDESQGTGASGIADPSEETTAAGLDRSSGLTGSLGNGLRLRMAIEATWRTQCGTGPNKAPTTTAPTTTAPTPTIPTPAATPR